MISSPSSPLLKTNQSQLYKLLKDAGHAVTVAGKCWNIDNKLAYWPDNGKFKFTLARGGKAGELRGSPESNFHQIKKMLAEV